MKDKKNKLEPTAPPAYVDQPPPPYHDYTAGYPLPPPVPPPNQFGYLQVPHAFGPPTQGQIHPLLAIQQVVTVQPTVYVTAVRHKADYLGYSIFTMLCCCLPLGIAALVYSIKTRDANLDGDEILAAKHSQKACMLNSAAVAIGIVILFMNLMRFF